MTYYGGPAAVESLPAFGKLLDVVAILSDKVGDVFCAFSAFGSRIGHRAAQSNVVADVLFALGFGAQILDVDVLDAIVAGAVASVVWLVAL
jgi:hypothetical protein